MLGTNMLEGMTDYENFGQSSLASWKARPVCSGNFIRNAAGHVVWSVGLHNARLVVRFGAERGCALQTDARSVYLPSLWPATLHG